MNIKHAKPEDAKYIQEAAERTWKETYIEILDKKTIESIIEDWYKPESLERQIKRDKYFYIVEENDSLIGFIHAQRKDSTIIIHRLYIYPEHWRRGVGTRLYEKLEQDLPEEINEIKLNVLPENDVAIDFYHDLGFETVETKQADFKGEKVQQEVMRKKLNGNI